MKRTIILNSLVACSLMLGIVACGGQSPTAAPTTSAVQAATAAPTAASTAPVPTAVPTKVLASPTPEASITPNEVTALAVQEGSDGAKGVTSHVKIGVEKATSTELRVGFFEEEVGGSGPQWRAAGWMAVIMSSLLVGADASEFRFTYDVGGYIDGPSAGGLMTVATLASLLGQKVKPDVAMTGTINPDGTIGPVGGIPHKIDGAAAAKIKLVLIPSGQRFSTDLNTGESVDVVERGKRQNVEVKEVTDVYEAYQLLVGSPLPKPKGMAEAQPELPSTSFDRTKGKAKEWIGRYLQTVQEYGSVPADYKFTESDQEVAEADGYGQKADSYYGQGMASAAYSQAVSAALYASIGLQSVKIVQTYVTGGMDSSRSLLQSLSSVNVKIDGLLDRMQTQTPESLGDIVAVSDAYGSINLAIGLADLAAGYEQAGGQDETEELTNLTYAALYYALSDHMVEIAKDSLDVGLGYGDPAKPSDQKVAGLAEMFRRAAEANINYFDNVVVEEYAKQAGVHADIMKARFNANDFNYMFARSSLQSMDYLKQRAGAGAAANYATLGGALNSYVLSSILVAKYYSLGAQTDENGNITGVANERAMINMLDFAEKRAREHIGFAMSLNAEPVQPVLYFEGAKVDREGAIADKFSALESFWTSALQSQMIGALSGKARLITP